MTTTPPETPQTPGAPQRGSNLGMEPNIAGLLCYVPCCVGLVFSIVAAIVEKQSRFIRFHAFQSLLLHAAMLVVGLGLGVLQIAVGAILGPLAALIALVSPLVGIVFLVLLIFLMVKAHGGEEYSLPTVGDMAKGWV